MSKHLHTFINVATSIDGKLTTQDRELHAFGGDEDRSLMEDLRADADAVMIGAGTLREEDPLLIIRDPSKVARRIGSGHNPQPIAVIVSNSLDFPVEGSKFFEYPGRDRFVFTSHEAPSDRFALVSQRARVFQGPTDPESGLDLHWILEQLAENGVSRLLLEGGGALNFAMMAAGLVDEIYHTLCPFVFGGDKAPTSFGGHGFPAKEIHELELKSLRQGASGRLFLRYECRRTTGVS